MVLNPDFREFIQLLNDNGVRYLVVGGYAVALHGHPRYTKDIDIWIELSPDNASHMMRVLGQFGFGALDLTEADFLVEKQIVQLGYPPGRIDIITSATGVRFADCYPSRMEVDVEGTRVAFIDLEHLIQNKRASGRLQDLADVEKLGG